MGFLWTTAPLLHLPRRDARLSFCLLWAKERGGWSVALRPERARAMVGLKRSVKRSVPIFGPYGVTSTCVTVSFLF